MRFYSCKKRDISPGEALFILLFVSDEVEAVVLNDDTVKTFSVSKKTRSPLFH